MGAPALSQRPNISPKCWRRVGTTPPSISSAGRPDRSTGGTGSTTSWGAATPPQLRSGRMLAFLIRRALQALLVMLVAALIAFTLFRFVGDPINQMVGLETPAAERAQLCEALGLNDPVIVQFGRFVWHALHLDFGISYQFKQPVVTLIGERFPATIELAFVSALLDRKS